MISFPNAKINLGLHVLRKREDGYHELETCLYPIELCDVLEIVKSANFSFGSTGLRIEGDVDSNLVTRAYDLIKTDHDISPVSIHLHKVIPMGAGLGGGSSDGAFALKILNDLFELGLENNKLREYAGQLGSDCPFFIDNTPAIATGTGTELQTLDLDLSAFRIELKHPDVHVSTSKAYELVTPRKPETALEEMLKLPVAQWRGALRNDFEEPILSRHAEIQQAKDILIQEGAVYAAMTGSGSCVFGLFKN